MDTPVKAQFKAFRVDELNPFNGLATFALESEDGDAISFERIETDPAVPEVVVPVDYRNCIGIITYIFDIIVAFIIRCLQFCVREESEESKLPAASFELSEKKVVLMECRSRGLKQSETLKEQEELYNQVLQCVGEVNPHYTKLRARDVAARVAEQWTKFAEVSRAQKNTPTFKASQEMTTAETTAYDIDGCKKFGYLRPPVTIERVDENRDGKLHQSRLRVILPYLDNGAAQEYVLFSGLVFGEESTSKREIKRAPTLAEGLLLQLGNEDWIVESQISSATGELKASHLSKAICSCLNELSDKFMPQSGTVTLHKLSGGLTGYSIVAKDLMFCRLNSTEGDEVEQSEEQLREKAIELENSLKNGLAEVGYIPSCELQRTQSQNKWQLKVAFIKADK